MPKSQDVLSAQSGTQLADVADAVPVVPPRNDPKALEPYGKSRALELAGRDPGFEYQWFRKDQLPTKTVPHEIGRPDVGYLMVDAWEVVHKTKGLEQGRSRDDAGKPVDTVMTNGELVLCRLPKSEFAKYAVIDRKTDELISKRLTGGEKHAFGEATFFKTRTLGGRQAEASSVNDILQGVA